MNDKEKITSSPEQQRDQEKLREAGEQARERLREQLERGVENSPEQSVENATHEALEKALSKETLREKHDYTPEESPAERRKGLITKAEKEASFKATMKEVHTQMSPLGRTFSKLIHNKTVERISDFTGKTIARPNSILFGSIFAFALTLGLYVLAKNLGYPLSGFETIGAFVLGWILGLLFDFVRTMVTGRPSQ